MNLSEWRTVSREVTWSDLQYKRITLQLRIDYGVVRFEAERQIRLLHNSAGEDVALDQDSSNGFSEI